MKKIFIDYEAAVNVLDKMCEEAHKKQNTSYWLALMNASIALTNLVGNKKVAVWVDVEEEEAQK